MSHTVSVPNEQINRSKAALNHEKFIIFLAVFLLLTYLGTYCVLSLMFKSASVNWRYLFPPSQNLSLTQKTDAELIIQCLKKPIEETGKNDMVCRITILTSALFEGRACKYKLSIP